MKLLSPAGDFDSLKAAIANGADEVYLGVKDFNARNNIAGFSLANLGEAVNYAHIFNVKVHLTVNILFRDDELQSAVDLIVEAKNLGVDAFIVQDLGLADIIHRYYPSFELHASTQLGIHNLEGVQAVSNLGFKRVVLSRETPLSEIKRIKENSNIEIEYFAQGALCVSFSGNCYLSSYEHDASGNRGRCKQLCRLPYSFRYKDKEIKNGYLLSAKDINMLEILTDLEQAGVDAIKIEGRARRPYYVATATKLYRQALDGKEYEPSELDLAFNRGYTRGYFDGNADIISKFQGHQGIRIGTVARVNHGKKFNEIFIKTTYDVSPKSSLKFFLNGVEEGSLNAYDVVRVSDFVKITTTQSVSKGASVNLLSDAKKENEINNEPKRELKIEIEAFVGQPITAVVKLGSREIKITGDILSEAKSSPLSLDDVKACFMKSEYYLPNINAKIEHVFIAKSRLNDFRRSVYDKVTKVLTEVNNRYDKITLPKFNKLSTFHFNFVDNTTKKDEKNIVINVCDLEERKILDIKSRFKENDIYLNLPNFALKEDIEWLKDIIQKYSLGIIVNNVYGLTFETRKVAGGGLNVYNLASANYLNMPILISEESALYANFVKMPYMTLRHCPMKQHLKVDCAHCPYKDGYEYVMQSGKRLKLKRVKMSTCTFYLTD